MIRRWMDQPEGDPRPPSPLAAVAVGFFVGGVLIFLARLIEVVS